MNNSLKPKPDTPIVKSTNTQVNKTITLEKIWSLLSDINEKVNTYDSGFSIISTKLSNLESCVNDLKNSMAILSSDLSKVKKENEVFTSEIQLFRIID